MESFTRLIPYIWPFRKRLAISVVLGVLVAGLWGANLTVAYPIMKVLLEHTTLQEDIETRIADLETRANELQDGLESTTSKLVVLDRTGKSSSDPEYIELLQSQSKTQRELAEKQGSLYRFQWLQCYVMPLIPRNEFQTFGWLIVLLLASTALKGSLIFAQDVLVGSVAESAVMNLRKEMLRKTLDLDYENLCKEGSSGLMSRFTYDAEQLSQGITLLGGRLLREPLKCLSCMMLALYFNWRLTLLSLVFLPLIGLFLSHFGKMLKRASRRMMESMSQIYKVLEETFDGLKVVVGYHTAEHHRHQFNEQYEGYYRKAMRVVRIDAAAKPLLELLGLIGMFVALVPGAYLVLRGRTHIWGIRLSVEVMTAAELGLIYSMLAGMLDPCRKLSSSFSRLKRSAAAIDRIMHLMDQDVLIHDPEAPHSLPRHQESIHFRDVSFRYQGRNLSSQRGLVLEHVDLEIQFGEVVALVGQNGCGKSTLTSLLPRYFDPEQGEVLIDGNSLKEYPLAELRGQLGIVTQDTVLFDGTILDNIRYGKPQATTAEVHDAARKAHLMPIIDAMPHGFDTLIGNKGKELSGGQRQRIALARVILRDPAILILDEATSATDAESESLIHETLKSFVAGRTTLLISHMLSQSLLNFVTRIVVMENGKIVASGQHEELLQMCPLYHRLYHSPSRRIGADSAKAA